MPFSTPIPIAQHLPQRPPVTRQRGAARPVRAPRWLSVVVGICLLASVGCRPGREFYFHNPRDMSYYRSVATSIEYPTGETSTATAAETLAPRTLWNHELTEYWDVTLEEAVQIALANSQVMRDLGGRVVTAPDFVRTAFDPAIQESDPRYGVEGALSRFDAQLSTSVFWERNDRITNNLLLGGGVFDLQQELGVYRTQLSKRNATGGQVAVRHNVDYDGNNRPFNFFPSAWNTNVEAEFRQPLLQGAGVEFNRIAGPGAQPGLYFQNGVLLARVDNDITLTEFEEGVRNLVNDVENAYWDLYFAYRDLDAKVAARDAALQTWRKANELLERGGRQGTVANESQAATQYFTFRAEVENALSGRPGEGTRAGLLSRSGNFYARGGLYAAESNLRLLMGLPDNDSRLIRPRDELTSARVAFDWDEASNEALVRRVELRRQRWRIRRRELEVVASRNFTRPQLDVVGLYRWRGFGDDLLGRSRTDPFDNAVQNLFDGDFEEWQLGLQYQVPLGFREGYAGLRNAQLKLARERAVLNEQERQMLHDLAAAMREAHRAYVVSQTLYNARLRAADRVEAVGREFDAGLATLDAVLDAQKIRAATESEYFRALVEYNLAIKAVHFEKGSLLDFNEIYLTEGPWPGAAYRDALRHARRRAAAVKINYGLTRPPVISAGEFPQEMQYVPAVEAANPLEALPPQLRQLPGGVPPSEVIPAPEGVGRAAAGPVVRAVLPGGPPEGAQRMAGSWPAVGDAGSARVRPIVEPIDPRPRAPLGGRQHSATPPAHMPSGPGQETGVPLETRPPHPGGVQPAAHVAPLLPPRAAAVPAGGSIWPSPRGGAATGPSLIAPLSMHGPPSAATHLPVGMRRLPPVAP